MFGDKRKQQQAETEQDQLIERLYQQIGQLQVELNWLKKKLGSRDVSGLRFWRSLKYEDVYLKSYEGGVETWQGIRAYMHFYNYERPSSALNGASPADVFRGSVQVSVLDRTAKV